MKLNRTNFSVGGAGGGRRHIDIGIVDNLRLNSVRVRSAVIAVSDISSNNAAIQEQGKPPIDGYLGADFLREKRAVIDCADMRVYLAGGYEPGRADEAARPLRRTGRRRARTFSILAAQWPANSARAVTKSPRLAASETGSAPRWSPWRRQARRGPATAGRPRNHPSPRRAWACAWSAAGTSAIFSPRSCYPRSSRAGRHAERVAAFPSSGQPEIGITWIGHASFPGADGGVQHPDRSELVALAQGHQAAAARRGCCSTTAEIDLVLVTHAHFDHLDRRTLRAVAANQPIVVPFGVGNLVHDLGFEKVHELDYWGVCQFGDVSITLTPCHHWGARMLHDQHRGFGGFVPRGGWPLDFSLRRYAFFDGFKEMVGAARWRSRSCPSGDTTRPPARSTHEPGGGGARPF